MIEGSGAVSQYSRVPMISPNLCSATHQACLPRGFEAHLCLLVAHTSVFGGWQKLPLKIKVWCSKSPNISTAASHCPLSKLILTPRAWGTSPDLQVSQICAGTSVDAKRSLFLGSASHGQEEWVLLHHTLPTPSVLPKCMGEHRLDPLKSQARTHLHPFEFLNKSFHSDRKSNWCTSMFPGQN